MRYRASPETDPNLLSPGRFDIHAPRTDLGMVRPQYMVALRPSGFDPLPISHSINNAVSAAGPGREFYRV